MNRKTMYWILIGAAVVIFFFNPFQRNKPGDIYKPKNSRSTVGQNVDFVLSTAVDPMEYVTGLFATRDIVFLGEFDRVRQQIVFVEELIPALYKAGIYNLGIEYALFSDQETIDSIITAPTYNEDAVYEILHNRMVIWGYQEYANIFKAAWKINASATGDSPTFRVVGLNVKQNYEHIKTVDDIEDPDVIAKVLSNGIPDVAMADVIIDEFVDKSQKALIFTTSQHSLTDYVNKAYEEKAIEQNLGDGRRAGNIIHDKIGNRAYTVLFHSPWPDTRDATRLAYAANGLIDDVLKQLPEDKRIFALDLSDGPLSETLIYTSAYAENYDRLTFGEITDGYIVLGPIAEYEPTTAIPGFINSGNIEDTLARFPGPKEEFDITAQEMNDYISGSVASYKDLFAKIK